MSDFPIFHGISLADNSWIENLHVEVLDADPVPLAAGRLWFNSADKVFKYSGLDATGAVIVRTFKDAEAAARTAADTAMDTRVTTVEGQVNGKIGNLAGLSTDEKGTIVGAINEVDANLDAEAARSTRPTPVGSRSRATISTTSFSSAIAGATW